jgi:hypothetical protein
MPTTSRRRRSARLTTTLTLLSAALLVAACGATPASVTPTTAPTPVVTPDPRLPDPTTADDVFRAIGAQGLRLTASNAITGTGTMVKRINASFGGWPLTISEFTSAKALTDRLEWDGEAPGGGEPAVAVAGSNILITWGPTSNGPPVAPDAARAARLVTLAETLHALLGPVQVRAIVRLPIPSLPPGTIASGDGSAVPSAEPEE